MRQVQGAALRQLPAEGDGRHELRAPLFASAMGRLSEDHRLVMADLGPARASTIDLLAGFRVRIDVVDLNSRLDELTDELDATPFETLVERIFPLAKGERYDLVLCWNLLNYFDRERLGMLMQCLVERTAPGALLHALIEYSSPHMPVAPAPIEPAGPEELVIGPVPNQTCSSPRYAARDLEKSMPGFSHERTMLLGNGMQEYLFRRASD